MDTPRRRRHRTSSDQSSGADIRLPRKKKEGTKKTERNSVKDRVPAALITIFIGVAFISVTIFVIDWRGIGKSFRVVSPHEKIIKKMMLALSEQASTLESIQDQASLQAAVPRLNKSYKIMVSIALEIDELNTRKRISRIENTTIGRKYTAEIRGYKARIEKEKQRILNNPAIAAGFKEVIQNAAASAGVELDANYFR